MSLVFYDTETTGTNTSFDQILQFAAIRTDDNLTEIDRFEIRCRLQPYVVPAPGAMRANRLRAAQLMDVSLPTHYGMVRAIREQLLAWSPARFVGYNSISFDENLLRQALYQTLHPPYLTNTGGNARFDVMKIVQAAAIFAPDALTIPLGDKGQYVFKLDQLAPANGFAHERAHDAMGDAEATLHLARVLKERAPHLWDTALRFSSKAAAIDHMATHDLFCLGEVYYGAPYAWTVTPIGTSGANPSNWYVYDLALDPAALIDATDEQLVARVGRTPKPVRQVRTNVAPIFMPYPEALGATSSRDIAQDEISRRALLLAGNEVFRERLIAAYEATQEVYEASPYVEGQIYDAFISDADVATLQQFHAAPWERRGEILARIADARLRLLGARLIFLERPETLNDPVRLEQDISMARRVLGIEGEVPWLTLPRALVAIEELLEAGGDDIEHLREHRDWLVQRAAEVEARLARLMGVSSVAGS